MKPESRRLAGILLVVVPTVEVGGMSLLTLLVKDPSYMQNPLRQNLWRAGHAHAGVMLILSLLILRYVDETKLKGWWLISARYAAPAAAILLPLAFFLSVLKPDATEPNALIYLAPAGAAILAIGLIILGVGLIRATLGGVDT
jgi:hypothetical protein